MTVEQAVDRLDGLDQDLPAEMGRALRVIITAAQERDAAVADLERVLWIGAPCNYCAKDKGKGGHSRLDRPCIPCEPKWRGMKERKKTDERT